MSNPVDELMNGGTPGIVAFLTNATCGEACWEAREDVCRCSCHGRNHGCMRTVDGVRPERTARIDGFRYKLASVGYEGDCHHEAQALNEAAGIRYYYADSSRDDCFAGCPAKIRRASKDQLARWPELAAAREEIEAIQAKDCCYTDWYSLWPYLLWVKV